MKWWLYDLWLRVQGKKLCTRCGVDLGVACPGFDEWYCGGCMAAECA